MNYKTYYQQASEISDLISSGEVTSVAKEQPQGLINRKPVEQKQTEQDKTSKMILDYFRAIDELPTRPKARPEVAPQESKRPPMKGEIPKGEKNILALTLEAEAGNQGFDGMLDVGSVIMNRVNSGKYGDSIEEVIMQPGQFSAWNSVTGYAGGEQGQDMSRQPSKEAVKAAEAILAGQAEDRTGGATHYFAEIPGVSERPKWANASFKPIGDHYFGKAK